jgi:DNA-directed RNA polymerase subunit RPC12/RpoP
MTGLVCIDCRRVFPPHGGRGRQSKRCPECLADHRSMLSQRRIMRMSIAVMSEWIEVVAPLVKRKRREVATAQDGRCLTCGEERRLFLAVDEDDQMIGLCADDYGAWLAQRRLQ